MPIKLRIRPPQVAQDVGAQVQRPGPKARASDRNKRRLQRIQPLECRIRISGAIRTQARSRSMRNRKLGSDGSEGSASRAANAACARSGRAFARSSIFARRSARAGSIDEAAAQSGAPVIDVESATSSTRTAITAWRRTRRRTTFQTPRGNAKRDPDPGGRLAISSDTRTFPAGDQKFRGCGIIVHQTSSNRSLNKNGKYRNRCGCRRIGRRSGASSKGRFNRRTGRDRAARGSSRRSLARMAGAERDQEFERDSRFRLRWKFTDRSRLASYQSSGRSDGVSVVSNGFRNSMTVRVSRWARRSRSP